MFPYSTYSSSSALEGPLSHLIPWPFLDDIDDEQHQNLPPPAALATNMIMSNIGDGDEDGVPLLVQKKQLPWKRDRHSKIRTAQGLRDRRMRLSVKVARKFFDLQDRLDFDKASKTIEWLLKNSEPAIKELVAVNNKYCISVSETNETDEITMQVTKPREKRKRRRAVARESRDKARTRARERTREKIMARRQSNNESTKQRCRDSAEADPNHNLEFPGFITSNNEAGNEFAMDCYAMTSKKTTLGNVQAQNNPNSQEHCPHHRSTTNGQWNPSSIFGTTPNNPQMNPIPNSIFMNTNALELGNSSPVFTAINSRTIGFHSQFLGNHFLL